MRTRIIHLKNTQFGDTWSREVEDRWDYSDFVGPGHPDWKNDWISFDSVLADDRRGMVWCGLTSFAGDIFYGYDRKSRSFRSMNFQSVGDRYDAKFHRALLFDRDDTIWAATALLHDIDRYWDAPGGALVHFNPTSEGVKIVARPMPHHYIQGMALDAQRRIIYGITFTPERFFRYDIESGRVTDLGPISNGLQLSQGATVAIDATGACWGTWSATRAWQSSPGVDAIRLMRYHPDNERIEYLPHGLPRLHGAKGTGQADEVHTGPDGAVYIGTAEGLLCRIDPETHAVEAIGKPGPARRLAAMCNGPDGRIYGTAGNAGSVVLFSYDPKSKSLVEHGSVFDDERRERAWHIHCLSICKDGTIYGGENDVPHRSGYLWEITGVI
jgi:hypothetical protein